MGAHYSCPSSRPELGRSQVIGVVAADEQGQRRVTFLPDPIPVTRQVRALDGPVALTEFLRFSSPCATTGCGHFRDGICGIARQVRRTVPAVTGELPACNIRPTCR